jgi:CRP/FNR family transcriptional regulator, anaerobic regulatory protein
MNTLKKLFPTFQSGLIEQLEKEATYQEVKAGEIMLRAGQYVKNTAIIISGQVKIYREDSDGGEFFMYYLHPGQACAISMICGSRNEKSQIVAKVMEDSTIMMIPLHLMDSWMSQYKSWSDFVLETYRSRFDEVLSVLDSIAFRAMDERLEFYLKRQQEACGCIDIQLSHQEIANDLNTSREVISRLLKKMEQTQLIKMNRNSITILNKSDL